MVNRGMCENSYFCGVNINLWPGTEVSHLQAILQTRDEKFLVLKDV